MRNKFAESQNKKRINKLNKNQSKHKQLIKEGKNMEIK